jgi:hypothetical protein
MSLPAPLATLSRDDLVKLALEQHQQIMALTAKVEALPAEVERLKREGQRQAALFSKGTRVTAPQKPGRKRDTRLLALGGVEGARNHPERSVLPRPVGGSRPQSCSLQPLPL